MKINISPIIYYFIFLAKTEIVPSDESDYNSIKWANKWKGLANDNINFKK
jgi:hypothetical protein